ncbi:PorT family protein [Aureispira anguillae]|uniref:PorT family protein n=1 Tax=Aureispira anguillae TaxID=2864201 RepID=A0A916DUC5_9BACT|nr:PorT family protein [Aureispira anguillae]BDS12131.1 PorT family protein [Aureispira anguillae]
MGIRKLFVSFVVGTIILLGSHQTQAQFFSMGIKGGVTTSNLFSQGTPTMGMTAGLIGELKFVKWMRLRAEANVLWHGTDKHFWEQDDIDYFAVGLPAILEIMPIKNFFIGAGAELDYLVHAQGAEMPDNRFNFGLVGHLEYRFFSRLGLGLRYVHNLGNFNKIGQIGDSINSGNKPTAAFPSSSLQMTLSYNF